MGIFPDNDICGSLRRGAFVFAAIIFQQYDAT